MPGSRPGLPRRRELRKRCSRVGRVAGGRVDGTASAAQSARAGGRHRSATTPATRTSAEDDGLGGADVDRRRRVQLLAGDLVEHRGERGGLAVGCSGPPSAPACRRSSVRVTSSAVGAATDATSAPHVGGHRLERPQRRHGGASPGPGDATSSGTTPAGGAPVTCRTGRRRRRPASAARARRRPPRHPLGHGDDDGVRPAAGHLDRGDLGQPGDPGPGGVDVDPQQRRPGRRCRRSPAPGRRAARRRRPPAPCSRRAAG